MQTASNIRPSIHKSLDPAWPKWGVVNMGSQTKWYDTEAEARLAMESGNLLASVKDLLDLMKLSWEDMEQVKAARATVARIEKGQP